MAQKGSKPENFETDPKNPDYGKSFETRMLEYRWLKAQADLQARLAAARASQFSKL